MVDDFYGLRGVALSQTMLIKVRAAAFAAGCAFALSGCLPGSGLLVGEKATRPLSNEMVETIERKGMAKDSSVLVRIFKEESELEIWKQTTEGKYELLKTYPICRWSGELGPKVKTGDRQAPEGFYMITPGLMNPNSAYYLAFNMGFPNSFDKALGRTGANLMVHGDCSSSGCYAMTDDQIAEIFSLAREAFEGGQRAFQVQAYPFRMTAKNLAIHRNNPNVAFWRMLKEGNDHFEVTRQEPKVEVCDKRYVFNAIPFDPAQSFSPQRSCPVYDQPIEVAEAVRAKREADNKEIATFVSRGTPTAPVLTYRDGGMNPAFASKFPERNPLNDQKVASMPGRQTESEVVFAQPAQTTAPAPKGPSVVSAATPAPAIDPQSKTASNAEPQKRGTFDKIGEWLGLHKKDTPQPQQAAITATPAPQSKTATAAPIPAAKPKVTPQTVSAKPVQQPRPPSTQEKDSAPAAIGTLPGSTPILSSGGFSSFR
jgi:murein L,D-transpeptidase YafK